jgi:hypothetical protein
MTFSDIFYPDNPKRQTRAGELIADITVSVSDLNQRRAAIDDALKEANDIIKNAFSKYAEPVPEQQEINLGESWEVSVIQIIATTVTYNVASYGLRYASISYLISRGRIGEAAFAKFAGLPRWFKAGRILGGVAAALMVAAVLDSIFGAIRRSRLRGIIKDLIPSRIKFKRAQLISDEILVPLRTLIATVKILEGRIPRDELVKIINDTIAEEHRKLDLITDDFVKSMLRRLDNSRGSWTRED